MNLTPNTPAQAFTPDAGVRWLATDPTMQHREAFEGTRLLTLNSDYSLMAPHFPGGTELLLSRVYGPAEMMPGAVYYMEETGLEGHYQYGGNNWRNGMGRLVELERCNEKATPAHGRFAFAHMAYDNTEEAKHYDTTSDGLFFWTLRFDGLRGRWCQSMREACPNYQLKVWRVSHYVRAPFEAMMADHEAGGPLNLVRLSGMTEQQRRWQKEAEAVRTDTGQLLTFTTSGLDYPAELALLLDQGQVSTLNYFLDALPLLLPSQLKKRKALAVTIHHRTYEGTTTRCYDQAAASAALDYLVALERTRLAYAALVNEAARRKIEKDLKARRWDKQPVEACTTAPAEQFAELAQAA